MLRSDCELMVPRIYADDIWPKKVPGGAQIPFLYGLEHSALLKEIAARGEIKKDSNGRTYYELPETHCAG